MRKIGGDGKIERSSIEERSRSARGIHGGNSWRRPMRRQSGSSKSIWILPQCRPTSPRSTKRQHQMTRKRKSSNQHSSPHLHRRISATSKELATLSQYRLPRESRYRKSKRQSKNSQPRKPPDRTKSPTSSSRSAIMK